MWNITSLSTQIKTLWGRITFSRLTAAYFIFSFLHFIIQLSFQSKAFAINANAAGFLNNIITTTGATNSSLPYLDGSSIRMCSWVSSDVDVRSCPIVWNGNKNASENSQPDAVAMGTYSSSSPLSSSSSLSSSSLSSPSPSSIPANPSTVKINLGLAASRTSTTPSSFLATLTTTVFATPSTSTIPPSTNGVAAGSNLNNGGRSSNTRRGVSKRGEPEFKMLRVENQTQVFVGGQHLSQSCLWALNWPVSVLDNTKREDIAFIAFQFWVLGMSVVALMHESIPHILASLLTHMMATAWASFQISRTAQLRAGFARVITNGACDGAPLLGNYWEARALAEISSLALNVAALLISCFLTWKLVKCFGWQTFKRVGASLIINRIYKIVLILSITIQLSLYFMAVTVSLWLDQLFNSPIGDAASFPTLYKVSSFIILLLLVPWLMTGWIAVRREIRLPMFFFLVFSIIYLGAWGVMFFSTTFRWAFVTWAFFSIMAVASVFLTLMSFILGVICRYNFGQGLLRHLDAHDYMEQDGEYMADDDLEKVHFPSYEKPMPTYSEAFGKGSEVPPPSQMFASRMGPRFYNRSATPFEGTVLPPPNRALVRNGSNSSGETASVIRSDSLNSERSFGSNDSYHSYSGDNHSRGDSQHSMQAKGWILE